MTERELGLLTVGVLPSTHLMKRCEERLGDLAPRFEIGKLAALRGVLVKERRRGHTSRFYLDVGGIGRFVLGRRSRTFVGITYLPRIHCHGLSHDRTAEGRSESENSTRKSEHVSCLDWFDRLMNSSGEWNLFAELNPTQGPEFSTSSTAQEHEIRNSASFSSREARS